MSWISKLSTYLSHHCFQILNEMPNTKLPRKEAKTSARVLTSTENGKMLEEKERKKKESLEEKEKKKMCPRRKK